MKHQEFIKEHGLKIKAQSAPANPHMQDEGRVKMDHWHVTITNEEGETFTLYYSMGPAHRTKPSLGNRMAHGIGYLAKHHKGYINSYALTTDQAIWNEHCRPTPPTLEDVLDCLASDCSSVENSRSFADFASELGYDEDSRSAERTYRVCQDQAVELENLLGRDAYKVLIWEMERL